MSKFQLIFILCFGFNQTLTANTQNTNTSDSLGYFGISLATGINKTLLNGLDPKDNFRTVNLNPVNFRIGYFSKYANITFGIERRQFVEDNANENFPERFSVKEFNIGLDCFPLIRKKFKTGVSSTIGVYDSDYFQRYASMGDKFTVGAGLVAIYQPNRSLSLFINPRVKYDFYDDTYRDKVKDFTRLIGVQGGIILRPLENYYSSNSFNNGGDANLERSKKVLRKKLFVEYGSSIRVIRDFSENPGFISGSRHLSAFLNTKSSYPTIGVAYVAENQNVQQINVGYYRNYITVDDRRYGVGIYKGEDLIFSYINSIKISTLENNNSGVYQNTYIGFGISHNRKSFYHSSGWHDGLTGGSVSTEVSSKSKMTLLQIVPGFRAFIYNMSLGFDIRLNAVAFVNGDYISNYKNTAFPSQPHNVDENYSESMPFTELFKNGLFFNSLNLSMGYTF